MSLPVTVHETDSEDLELEEVQPAQLTRPTYLRNTAKLLLFVGNSSALPDPPVIPTLQYMCMLIPSCTRPPGLPQ
jgi:hypothetical protein